MAAETPKYDPTAPVPGATPYPPPGANNKPAPQTILSKLKALLGQQTVFLLLDLGSKEINSKGWPTTTYQQTQSGNYPRLLLDTIRRGGNIGVLLGSASQNLCSIDIDEDSEVEPFLNLNPALRHTFRTRGAKGCQIFVRIRGPYPETRLNSKASLNGHAIAEWRGGGGHQSVVFGRHPDTGKDYQWTVEIPVIELAFSEILWLEHWKMSFAAQSQAPPPQQKPQAQTGSSPQTAGQQPPPPPQQPAALDPELVKRITKFVNGCPIAVTGQGGDQLTFKIADTLINGYALSFEDALSFFKLYSNRCRPHWTEKELRNKLKRARLKPSQTPIGWLLKTIPFANASPKGGAGPDQNADPFSAQAEEEKFFQELLAKYRSSLLTSHQLETAPIEPRLKLCGEWFWEADLGFVFAPRGIGKTWFVDALAVHLSTGRNLDSWTIPKPVPVLYIDGEMPEDTTRDRLKGLASGNNNLIVLHHEELFNRVGLTMNLGNPLTQKVVTELCVEKGIKVMILDNLSCLVSGVAENDGDAWEQLLPWLLDLRRRRIAVVIVHHAGASGKRMRGHTKREDPAAWIIKLEATEAINPEEEGAKFEMSFTKKRSTPKPEWIRIWHFKTEADGQVSIGCEEISFDLKVLQLVQAGLESPTDIAQEIDCAKSTVCKAAKRLEAKNLIEIRNRRYHPRNFMNQP